MTTQAKGEKTFGNGSSFDFQIDFRIIAYLITFGKPQCRVYWTRQFVYSVGFPPTLLCLAARTPDDCQPSGLTRQAMLRKLTDSLGQQEGPLIDGVANLSHT